MRRAAVIGCGLAVLMALSACAGGGGSASPPTTDSLTPKQGTVGGCVSIYDDWINYFERQGSTGAGYTAVYRILGTSNPFSQDVLQMAGQYQADVVEYGQASASTMASNRILKACQDSSFAASIPDPPPNS